jgi:hypothetical protein
MHLDLKKIPFGRRLSRHMLYEETDNLGAGWAKGLYLALATDIGGGFIGGPMMGPKGFALVTPTFNGTPLTYTYEATPSAVTLTTDKGSLRFAIDGTKVLRVEGRGVGLRIDGRLGFGSICIETPRGTELTVSGGIYLMAAQKGQMTLDCHWDLKALHSTDPIITIEPDESGALALAIYDTDDAYELPPLSESLAACADAAAADFDAFAAGIKKPADNHAFFDTCVYALWTGFQSFKGKALVPSNKMSDMKIYTVEQPMAALPMTDASKVLELLAATLSFATPQGMVPTWLADRQNLAEAVPPVYAYVVSRLVDNGDIKTVLVEKLADFYSVMWKTVNWWLTKRTDDNALVYYAYRHESGWPKEHIFGAGLPAVTPDLQTYIILAAESLSKIAAMLGKVGEAASWGDISRKQLSILTETLWNGDGFDTLHAATDEKAPCTGMLSLLPLLLGKRLPDDILDKLTETATAVRFEEMPILPAALLVLGLQASGKAAEAKAAADTLVKSCADGGANDARGKGTGAGAFFPPAACAALLAVGGLQ